MTWASWYIRIVIAGGTAVLVVSVLNLAGHGTPAAALVLVALSCLSGIAGVRLPAAGVTVSSSDMFALAAAVLYGPAAGTLAVGLDSIAMVWHLRGRNHGWRRQWFSVAASPAAMWLASSTAFGLAGLADVVPHGWWLVLIVCAGLYFPGNAALVTLAVGLSDRQPLLTTWREICSRSWLSYVGGAYAAALLIALYQGVGLTALVLLLPLPFLLSYTLKISLARADEQIRHLEALQHHHESTIEAFAHAVDAKDQVTHGHIRRVQTDCLKLAARIGVSDPREVRALQAGALLHDLGKIATPEHILNKPGPLTTAELAQMQAHAVKGAEILSAIQFDYPVIPIVRHHHENWDGTGYPDGLAGEAIPLGARILQVVDCFDALTSDRPYRPRMTTTEALAILRNRRGSMYDPGLVDAFVAMRAEVTDTDEGEADAIPPRSASHTLETPQLPSAAPHHLDRMGLVCAFARQLADAQDVTEAGRQACAAGILMFGGTGVFYAYDHDADRLHAVAAAGADELAFIGTTLVPGRGVTGWVAVNRRILIGADARLDQSEGSENVPPRRSRCLATPVWNGSDVIGVLTWYADAFQDQAPWFAEAVSEALGDSLTALALVPVAKA